MELPALKVEKKELNGACFCSLGNVFLFMEKRELTEQIEAKQLDETVITIVNNENTHSPSKFFSGQHINRTMSSKSRKTSQYNQRRRMSVASLMQKKMNNLELNPEELEFIAKFHKKKVMEIHFRNQCKSAKSSGFFFKFNNSIRIKLEKKINSRLWRNIIRALLLIELFSECMMDFSHRASTSNGEHSENETYRLIQMVCNVFFALEAAVWMVAKGLVLDKGVILRNRWNIVNVLVIISSFLAESAEPYLSKICSCIKITRIFRLLFTFQNLKNYVLGYFHAFYSVGGYFFNFLFFMFFYAVVGTHFFKGLLENRCRTTEFPPSDRGQAWGISPEFPYLCDKSHKSCPEGTFCKTLFENGLDSYPHEAEIPGLNYGKANFDNFFMAFLTNLNFVSFTGWSSVNDIFYLTTTQKFWKAIDPSLFVFYGITLKIVLGVVLKNMLIAGVYQGLVSSGQGILNYSTKEKIRIEQEEKSSHLALSLMDVGSKSIKNSSIERSSKNVQAKAKLNRNNNKKIFFLHSLAKKKGFQKNIPIFLSCLCLLNISIFIAREFSSNDSTESIFIVVDKFITCVYMADCVLRLMLIIITRSGFDIIIVNDMAVTILPFLELVLELNSIYLTAGSLKYLKILRLFKLLQYVRRLRALTLLYKETLMTLYRSGYFLITVFLIILIISLIGRELFAYTVKFDLTDHLNMSEGHSPRLNYDNTFNSFTTTIIIFYNEEWHAIMYEYMRGYSDFSSIFFALALMIGDFFCMKIFMALFINNLLKSQSLKKFFGLRTYWSRAIQKIRKKLKKSDNQFKVIVAEIKKERVQKLTLKSGLAVDHPILETVKFPEKFEKNCTLKSAIPGHQPMTKTSLTLIKSAFTTFLTATNNYLKAFQEFFTDKGTKKYSRLGKKSLGIWELESSFRKRVFILITHPYYERFILLLIFTSCLLLMVRNPLEDPDSAFNNFLFITDVIFLFFYFLEIFLSSVVYGFLFNGKYSFLRLKLNMFDFAIFIVTILGTIDTKYVLVQGIYIKICRAFRIFKLIKFHDGLRLLFTTLFNSLNQLFYLLLFYLIPLIIFAFITSKIFRGGFDYCTGLEESFLEEYIKTRSDCFDWGGDWLVNDFNYDTVFQAMGTLFQIATTENWISIMFNSWDFVGPRHSPEKNNQPLWIIFFIIYFFVCNVVMANILVGIFVEKFMMEKEKKNPFKEFTEEQKEWALVKSSIYSLKPRNILDKPSGKALKFIGRVINSESFYWIDFLVSIANMIVLSLCWHRQSPEILAKLGALNIAFNFTFFIQIHLKLVYHGPVNFSRKKLRNILEYVAVVFSFVTVILKHFIAESATIDGFSTGLQILKVLPIVRKIPMMRRLLAAIYCIVPQAVTITMLLIIFLIIYSLIGVEFFAFLKKYKTVGNEDVNFRTFSKAMHALIRGATGEGWPNFLSDSIRQQQPNFSCTKIIDYEGFSKYGLEGCGKPVGYVFWYSFTIIITWLILNLFFALILSSIDEYKSQEDLIIGHSILKDILNLWGRFDPSGKGFISYKDFWVFSSEVIPILGLKEEEFKELNKKQDFMRALQLPVYIYRDDYIYGYKFHDSVINLCKLMVMVKYRVLDLEPARLFKQDIRKHFKMKKENNLFIKTNLTSADLACFVTLQKFLLCWKMKSSMKNFSIKEEDPVVLKPGFKTGKSLFYQKSKFY